MLSYTGGLVLFAALLHASWNAMLRGNRDRFLSMTWMCIAIAAVSTLVVLFTPWPTAAAWPYIVVSELLHIVYNVSLVRACSSRSARRSSRMRRSDPCTRSGSR